MNESLRDSYRRSGLTGEQTLNLNSLDQTKFNNDYLSILQEHEDRENYEEGGTMVHMVLQPYFTLSGYKLRAEPDVANEHRFCSAIAIG